MVPDSGMMPQRQDKPRRKEATTVLEGAKQLEGVGALLDLNTLCRTEHRQGIQSFLSPSKVTCIDIIGSLHIKRAQIRRRNMNRGV
jgi:hypothetical protein